ncbi:MAG: hypothetical protein U9N72_04470 [Bacteroidota bacterium]|nr:hypothetical protein [Bacteroidota bacterium]
MKAKYNKKNNTIYSGPVLFRIMKYVRANMLESTNLSPIVTMVNTGCRSASLVIPTINTMKDRAIITGNTIPGSKRSLTVSPAGKTYMATADKAKRSKENNKRCINIRTGLFIR